MGTVKRLSSRRTSREGRDEGVGGQGGGGEGGGGPPYVHNVGLCGVCVWEEGGRVCSSADFHFF